MDDSQSLSHSIWECKYHLVWIPKYLVWIYVGRWKNFLGQSFWARGHYVSTVGADETAIRQYIQRQEAENRRLDQLHMFK